MTASAISNAPAWLADLRQSPNSSACRMRARVDLEVLTVGPDPGTVAEIQDGLSDIRQGITSRLSPLVDFPVSEARGLVRSEGPTVAQIQGLSALAVQWRRNPPSVADELDVVVRANVLPVDFEVLRGARVNVWLFVHDNIDEPLQRRSDRCRPGDAGHFAGVVDNISRDSAQGTLRLTCRDITAIPLEHTADPRWLASLPLDRALWEVVDSIISAMPGGEQWRVVPRGRVATETSPQALLGDEKTQSIKVRDAQTLDYSGAAAASEKAAQAALAAAAAATPAGGTSWETAGGSSWGEDAATEAKKTRERLEGLSVKVPAAYKRVTEKILPPREAIWGAESGLSTWGAITRLCAVMGCVAEAVVLGDGSLGVAVVDVEEYTRPAQGQSGSEPIRFFARGGRSHRVLNWGRNIERIGESKDLLGGARVDWVEVTGIVPGTGKVRRAIYGRDPSGIDGVLLSTTSLTARQTPPGKGVTIPAHGVADKQHLEQIARAAWLQLNRGEVEVHVVTGNPWSSGGSPRDPDLLGVASGAAVEIGFPESTHKRGQTLVAAMRSAGVPEAAADVLADASKRLGPAPIFQVNEVSHRFEAETDQYDCTLGLQRFIDDPGARPGPVATDDLTDVYDAAAAAQSVSALAIEDGLADEAIAAAWANVTELLPGVPV